MAAELDRAQREAVRSSSNTVVTAGAGSGKTTVLARRFVHLIGSGAARVDGILTLTFTRKAAAEMYERIYRLLLEKADEAGISEEVVASAETGTDTAAQLVKGTDSYSQPADGAGRPQTLQELQRYREAIASFDKAQISTLDSFCARIVRGGSARFGVSGDFRQDEHAAAQLNVETALQFLLEHAAREVLRRFIEAYGMEQVLDQFLVPLADEEFHLAREHDFPEIFRRQRDYLYEEARKIVHRMEVVREWFLSPDLPGDKKSLQNVRAEMQKHDSPVELFTGEDWTGLQAEAAAKVADRTGAAKDPVLQEAKARIQEWKAAANELGPIVNLFIDEEMYRGVYALLNEYQQRILQARRSSGVLTFRDVVEMAVLLLREDADLRAYYKGHFSHIMIDEFQDNNDLQRELLFLLAEKQDSCAPEGPGPEDLQPGKLFFVGDEKQSIYKFRGADVRVLKKLQDQLRQAGGSSLQLDRNYRSHSGLIGFFNALFTRILAPADNEANAVAGTAGGKGGAALDTEPDSAAGIGGANDFEARFSPLTAPCAHTAFKPTVRLFYKPFDPDREGEGNLLSSSEAEAWTVVRYIKEMVESGKLMVRERRKGKKEAPPRPVTYDDVAILMRSSSNQINFEKYLRRSRIPYSVQSIRSLFQEAPVNDIYQFLQLLIYPGDRNAYAALLRSPFVHLSDDSVLKLLLDDGDDEGRRKAFSHSGTEELFGSEREKTKYLQAKEVYERLKDLSAVSGTAGLIRYLWYEAGYRYVVLRNPDYHLYLEFYDALISLARMSDTRGENLAVFLDFIRENLGDYKKLEDLDLLPRESGGVQLLSIHKSKGLEFPVVVVADMGNAGAGEKGRLFVWDDDFQLALNLPDNGNSGRKRRTNYFSEMAGEKLKQQDAAELKRLLYVACTRAQDHLILSGHHHSHNRKPRPPEEQNVLLNMVLQAFGWDGEVPPPELTDTLGCTISPIEDYTVESVLQQSSFSRGLDLEKVRKKMEATPVTVRSFPKLEWTPTELNLVYRRLEGGAAGTEDGGNEPRARVRTGAGDGESDGGIHTDGRPVGPIQDRFLDDLDALIMEHDLAAPFGELVHSCIEYGITGRPGRPPMPDRLLTLEPGQITLLEDGSRRMADVFLSGPLGKEVKTAAAEGRAESELPFVLCPGVQPEEHAAGAAGKSPDSRTSGAVISKHAVISGQIDLLLVRSEEVVVLDFKTDHSSRPQEYAAQMAMYRQAAEAIYKRPAKSMLVYLRTGQVCEIDMQVDLPELLRTAGTLNPMAAGRD